MPDTIDHNRLLLFVNHVYDTVVANTQPVPVLTLQFFGLGMGKRLLFEGEDRFIDFEKIGIRDGVEFFFH
jgi:hypothetical protein